MRSFALEKDGVIRLVNDFETQLPDCGLTARSSHFYVKELKHLNHCFLFFSVVRVSNILYAYIQVLVLHDEVKKKTGLNDWFGASVGLLVSAEPAGA